MYSRHIHIKRSFELSSKWTKLGLQKLRFPHTKSWLKISYAMHGAIFAALKFLVHAQQQLSCDGVRTLYQRHKYRRQISSIKETQMRLILFLCMGVSCKMKIQVYWHATTVFNFKRARGHERISLNVTSLTNQTWKSIRKMTENNLGAKRIYYFSYLWKGISWVGCFVQLLNSN